MTLRAERDEVAPALTVAVVVIAVGWAGAMLAFTALDLSAGDGARAQRMTDRMLLVHLAQVAAFLGAAALIALGGLELARARRSSGAFAVAAAGAVLAGWIALEMVAMWSWPWHDASRGWRLRVLALDSWVRLGALLAITAGVAAAGWADRIVRVVAAPALGAAALMVPPPPLYDRARALILPPWDPFMPGGLPEWRSWVLPGLLALGALGWGALVVVMLPRQPRGAARALEPHRVAAAAVRLGIALVAVVVIAVAAGATTAVLQGRPVGRLGALEVALPAAVAVATTAVAIALLGLAWADVAAAARRRLAIAALGVLWLAAVLAGQIVWSRRSPRPDVFTVFHPPWMSPMLAAAVAIVAMVAVWSALAHLSARAGLPRRRGHTAVVALALALGALTAPWVLGFGRARALDATQIATLVTTGLVNLGAFVAVARAAFQVAAVWSPGSR